MTTILCGNCGGRGEVPIVIPSSSLEHFPNTMSGIRWDICTVCNGLSYTEL